MHYFPLDGVLAGRLFAAFDKDRNGHIDRDEFLGEKSIHVRCSCNIRHSSKLSKQSKPILLLIGGGGGGGGGGVSWCLQAWFSLQTGLNLLWVPVSFSEEIGYCL